MSTTQAIECIHQLFESSCIELFQGLSCDVTREDMLDADWDQVPLACIDAGSDDLELTIILRVPFSVLSTTYRGVDAANEGNEAQLEDWLSELANQLVGRLKNKLLNYGCTLKIGLPTSYFDVDLDELPIATQDRSIFCFDVDNELIECSLCLEIFNGDLTLVAQDDIGGAGEGELELF